jgi:hypothetical protein
MDDVAELLAAGVPDLRLTTLAEKYEQLVQQVDVEQRFRDGVPHVAELCDQLAYYQIPETIQHDGLHDGQVFVLAGRHLMLDWGDACVSHPSSPSQSLWRDRSLGASKMRSTPSTSRAMFVVECSPDDAGQ